MVNDTDDLRLIQAGNGLTHFVMIHENDLFPAGPNEMIAGESADHLIFIIQDGISTETALDHNFPDIVQIVVQVKIMQISGAGDTSDGNGLENQP